MDPDGFAQGRRGQGKGRRDIDQPRSGIGIATRAGGGGGDVGGGHFKILGHLGGGDPGIGLHQDAHRAGDQRTGHARARVGHIAIIPAATEDVLAGGGHIGFLQAGRIGVVAITCLGVGVHHIPRGGADAAGGRDAQILTDCAHGDDRAQAAALGKPGVGAVTGTGNIRGNLVVAPVTVSVAGRSDQRNAHRQEQLAVVAVGRAHIIGGVGPSGAHGENLDAVIQTELLGCHQVLEITGHRPQGHQDRSGSAATCGAAGAVTDDQTCGVRSVVPVQIPVIRIVVVFKGVEAVVGKLRASVPHVPVQVRVVVSDARVDVSHQDAVTLKTRRPRLGCADGRQVPGQGLVRTRGCARSLLLRREGGAEGLAFRVIQP